MRFFFRGLMSLLGPVLRYLLVSGLCLLLMMSLVSGRFPPPVLEYWRSLKSLQSAMGSAPGANALVKIQARDQNLMQLLNGQRMDMPEGPSERPLEVGHSPNQKARLQALETEVRRLRADLHRSQQEVHQLKHKSLIAQFPAGKNARRPSSH